MPGKNQLRAVQQLHLRKFREKQRRFIAEGVKTVLEIASERPALLETVYATDAFFSRHEQALAREGIELVQVSEEELKKLSMQVTPNQVLAVCRFLEEAPDAAPPSLAFFLDDIRDPGNLGTILRISDWFGMRTLYCSPESCELYNPKVIQASMGAFLRVSVIYDALGALLRRQRFAEIYGAVLGGRDIYREDLGDGLIIIGNEANGISPENMAHITKPLSIPRAPASRTESLNAAMAAGIIAAEFYRRSTAHR